MKIIAFDNFGRDYNGGKDERIVAENIYSISEAKIMLEALQKNVGDNGPEYYKLEPDDYVLYKFEGY